MTTQPLVHPLPSYVTRELYRDWITIFTITDVGRAAMDQWFEYTDAWYTEAESRPEPANRILLCLQDFSQVEAGVTPYGRSKAQELASKHPDLKGRSAVIISHALYVQATTAALIRTLEGNIERHVFHEKAAGLKWLEEWVPDERNLKARPTSSTARG